MALENLDISGYSDDGTGLNILYYLEADTSRSKMVGLQPRK
jgi:hypothetical protein